MSAKVAKCNCKNEFQDREYGPYMRVMNKITKKAGDGKAWYRCTVCTKEYELKK